MKIYKQMKKADTTQNHNKHFDNILEKDYGMKHTTHSEQELAQKEGSK